MTLLAAACTFGQETTCRLRQASQISN